MRPFNSRQGFTLIELMLVVAIVGILASLAIPSFLSYQYRARSAEGAINVQAINSGELAYHAAKDIFLTTAAIPAGTPGSQKRPWADPAREFEILGLIPDGPVYFQYQVAVSPSGQGFTAAGRADVDGNGIFQVVAYERRAENSAEAATCPFECIPLVSGQTHIATPGVY